MELRRSSYESSMTKNNERTFQEYSCNTQQPDTATRECSENVLKH